VSSLHADGPIGSINEDLLGRASLVKLIAAEILQAPTEDGFVLSLMAPWGAGKTSVLNLIEGELGGRAEVLRFDPWLFSGAEQLVTRFFAELGGQLRASKSDAMRDLAGEFLSYGDIVSPLVPLIFGRTGTAVTAVLQRRRASGKPKDKSALEQRRELRHRLGKLERPIVVFVDDIDRLAPEEVREVVRLVKLVGDLPGVRYVLAFDRRRVELALGEGAEDGRAYLEKIVQAPHDLPLMDPGKLRRFALEVLNERLRGVQLSFFSQAAWGNLYGAGVAPMMKTLRDARRFANVAPAALTLTGGEVAAHDVLALEALRIFDPDVHGAIPDIAGILTGSGIDLRPQEEIDAETGTRMQQTLKGSAHPEAARHLLRQLFPAAGHLLGGSRGVAWEWRARRRVADTSVLDIYLQATIGEDAVSTSHMREVLGAMNEPPKLRELLEATPDEQLADLCDRLTELQSAFPADHAGDAAMVVALQELRLSDRSHGPMSAPARWRVTGLVDALLGKAADPLAAVRKMIDVGPDLSYALRVANRYGTFKDREEREREILDEQATRAALDDVRGRVRRAAAEQLRREPELRILLAGILEPDEAAGRAEIVVKARDDDLMRALMRQSFGWGYRSNETGTWPIPQLDWDGLLRMLGEDVLSKRVLELAPSIEPADEDERVAWELAVRYASGEKPPRFP
jgi:hypothetical protein